MHSTTSSTAAEPLNLLQESHCSHLGGEGGGEGGGGVEGGGGGGNAIILPA
jgi:hypothetical protein